MYKMSTSINGLTTNRDGKMGLLLKSDRLRAVRTFNRLCQGWAHFVREFLGVQLFSSEFNEFAEIFATRGVKSAT